MQNRMFYLVIVAIGVVLILLTIFAHQLGIGSTGFGLKKIIAIIVGAAFILYGLWSFMRQTSGVAGRF